MDVKHQFSSIATERYRHGYSYAENNYEDLISGMSLGETFKFVSHSMGGAYAKGMRDYLVEQGWTVEEEVYINTYQALQIKPADGRSFVIDYRNTDDPVVSGSFSRIRGRNIKIREESGLKFKYRHKYPMSHSNAFWDSLTKQREGECNRMKEEEEEGRGNTWWEVWTFYLRWKALQSK